MFWLVDAAGDTSSKIVTFALAHVPKKSKNCRFTTGAVAVPATGGVAALARWVAYRQLSWEQHFRAAMVSTESVSQKKRFPRKLFLGGNWFICEMFIPE